MTPLSCERQLFFKNRMFSANILLRICDYFEAFPSTHKVQAPSREKNWQKIQKEMPGIVSQFIKHFCTAEQYCVATVQTHHCHFTMSHFCILPHVTNTGFEMSFVLYQ